MLIYADITFFNNFLMTLAIVWAVGHLLEYEIKGYRIVIASLIGTIYTFIFLFLQLYSLPIFLKISVHLSLNLFTAILIIKIAYQQEKNLKKGVAYLYLVSFVTIGTTLAIFYINGGKVIKTESSLLIIISVLILFLIGKFGYMIFQNYITPDIFYVPVTIIINKKSIKLTGLIDTGNSLTDPLTKVPVIIITQTDILPIFDKDVQREIKNNKGGIVGLIEVLNSYGWGKRIRILPFAGVGQEQGMLIGLRPDKVLIEYKGQEITTEKVIVALSEHKLNKKDEYQVLLHPQIIQISL